MLRRLAARRLILYALLDGSIQLAVPCENAVHLCYEVHMRRIAYRLARFLVSLSVHLVLVLCELAINGTGQYYFFCGLTARVSARNYVHFGSAVELSYVRSQPHLRLFANIVEHGDSFTLERALRKCCVVAES